MALALRAPRSAAFWYQVRKTGRRAEEVTAAPGRSIGGVTGYRFPQPLRVGRRHVSALLLIGWGSPAGPAVLQLRVCVSAAILAHGYGLGLANLRRDDRRAIRRHSAVRREAPRHGQPPGLSRADNAWRLQELSRSPPEFSSLFTANSSSDLSARARSLRGELCLFLLRSTEQ